MPETESVIHRNMRMGISVSGYMMATAEQQSWLAANYVRLREFDRQYSAAHQMPASIKLTTVKPAGTTGLVTGVTPGIHPGFAPYFIRRVRMAAESPIAKWCEARRYPVEFELMADGTPNYSTVVVSFPCTLPADRTRFVDQCDAIAQLQTMTRLQREWSDNAISISVQYRVAELDTIIEWLRINYNESVKSVSFIQYSGHGFRQAPFEAISAERYHSMVGALQSVAAAPVAAQPAEDDELLNSQEAGACVGVCPLR